MSAIAQQVRSDHTTIELCTRELAQLAQTDKSQLRRPIMQSDVDWRRGRDSRSFREIGQVHWIEGQWHCQISRRRNITMGTLQPRFVIGDRMHIVHAISSNDVWCDLLINRVRIERLHSISRKDCVSEGLLLRGDNPNPAQDRSEFQSYWQQSYAGMPFFDWYANPWVWVVEFEKVKAS